MLTELTDMELDMVAAAGWGGGHGGGRGHKQSFELAVAVAAADVDQTIEDVTIDARGKNTILVFNAADVDVSAAAET